MIAKISSGKDIYGLIEYHENKVQEQKASLLFAKDFFHLDRNLYLKTFRSLLNGSQSTRENTFHASINLPAGEQLSDEQFCRVGEEYLKKLGYQNQPYLIYRHFDKEQQAHIHLVSVRVRENGTRINDFGERRKSQEISRELENQFNLSAVSNVKSTSQNSDKIYTPTGDELNNIKQVKRYISIQLQSALQFSKPRNLEEMQVLLLARKIGMEQVVDKNTDEMKGLVYFIRNDEGKRISCGIKASAIYYNATLKKLNTYFTKNESNYKINANFITNVRSAVESAKNIKELRQTLKSYDIRLLKARKSTDNNPSFYSTYYFLDQKTGYLHAADALGIEQQQFEKLRPVPATESIQWQQLFDTYPEEPAAKKKRRKKRRNVL